MMPQVSSTGGNQSDRESLRPTFGRFTKGPVSPRTVDQPLHRMVVQFLDDNLLVVCLMGEDRTGLVHHLSRQVADLGLNIDESYGTRLQSKHASFFLISGRREDLRLLARSLKKGRHDMLKGRIVLPSKLYDLTVRGPDRVGLICDICTLLKEYDINIRTLDSFAYMNSEEGRSPGSDLLWTGYIHVRLEVSEERLSDLSLFEQRLYTLLNSEATGEPRHSTPPWEITLEERQLPDKDSPRRTRLFHSRN